MRRMLRLGSLESPRSLRSKMKGDRRTKEDGFSLLHLGQSSMSDLKSPREALAIVQQVKQTSREQKPVQLTCAGSEISVVERRKDTILSCSLLCVAQCVQETTQGFSDCIAVSFTSGAWMGECHVFQAKSSREVLLNSFSGCMRSLPLFNLEIQYPTINFIHSLSVVYPGNSAL